MLRCYYTLFSDFIPDLSPILRPLMMNGTIRLDEKDHTERKADAGIWRRARQEA